MTQFTKNDYLQPRRPPKSGGPEGWESIENSVGDEQVAGRCVQRLKWLSELMTWILRRQKMAVRGVQR